MFVLMYKERPLEQFGDSHLCKLIWWSTLHFFMLMPLPHLKSLQLDVALLNGTPAPIGDSHYASRFGVTANGSLSSVPYHCGSGPGTLS